MMQVRLSFSGTVDVRQPKLIAGMSDSDIYGEELPGGWFTVPGMLLPPEPGLNRCGPFPK